MVKKLLLIFILLLSACSEQPKKQGFNIAPDYEKQLTSYQKNSKEQNNISVPLMTNEIHKTVDSNIIVVTEKLFLSQINDIYYNFSDYENKTIVVEGMYTLFSNEDKSKVVPVVFREGPGCCGNDGWGGFLLNIEPQDLPDKEWIKVTGKPYLEKEDGYTNLFLEVESIEVTLPRGKEFVTH
ncbi:hypothetical protein EII25_01325 [Erysipelotrichaceae bacterium OH741_COT-311]|nr:hypothetical protein EII25_01325 [Erysipelotrichaceae bacterium OH741_COT-311]